MTAHLKDISSFLAMEVLARAQELEANGRNIIHLEVGEPDFQAPSEALETVINSLSRKALARYRKRNANKSFFPPEVKFFLNQKFMKFLIRSKTVFCMGE